MTDKRREEKRTHLLNAARAVVARFGIRKTTLEDIAAEARVSRATLYYYFPNREAIFRELVIQEIERFQRVLIAAIEPEATPDERLMAYVRTRFAHLRDIKSMYSVTEHLARAVLPIADDEFQRFQEAEMAFLASLVREGMTSGRFRSGDPDLLAAAMFAAVRGLDERFIFEDRDAIEEAAECLFQTLFTGLLA
jgi:TetR/AcrR family transcriptional regulator